MKLLRHFLNHQEVQRGALAEHLGLSAPGLRKKIRDYLNKELVEKAGAGGYRRTRRLVALLEHLQERNVL